MELKMVNTLIKQAMNLMELIPWNDEWNDPDGKGQMLYPGLDEELQAAYEHLDEAMGVLQSPLAEIKRLEEENAKNVSQTE